MNEFFSTIDDALLLLRVTAEDPSDNDTADKQSRTIPFAANRLARMIGLDIRSVSIEEARAMAQQIVSAAAAIIGDAFAKVHRRGTVIMAGHGQDLLRLDRATDVEILADHFGHAAARCAPLLCSR